YRTCRNEVLASSMAGYALFYFCRNNLPIAMPAIEDEFKLTGLKLGMQGATLYMTYGVCKLLSGLVADRGSPRAFIVGGLVLSVLANLWFGFGTTIGVLSIAWSVNGVVQALGAPASAKLMAQWFSVSERGTKTGIWNMSHQGGGGL